MIHTSSKVCGSDLGCVAASAHATHVLGSTVDAHDPRKSEKCQNDLC